MWIKKNKDDIRIDKKNKKKKAIKFGLWTFIFMFIAIIYKDKYIGPGGMHGRDLEKPLTWFEIYEGLYFYIIIAIWGGYLFYLFKAKVKSTTIVCDKCGKVKHKSENLICECGGKYTDLDLLKWVDE